MTNKIFRCKVWTPSLIHFDCRNKDEALGLATRFFSDTEQSLEEIVEVPRDSVEADFIYEEKHVPKLVVH